MNARSVAAVGTADRRAAWRAQLAARLPAPGWRTRFAPAPTGYLHLGHLVNALSVWGVARAHGGVVALRIEDHDRARCRPEFEAALLDDLEWLGFEADIAPARSFREQASGHPYRQSDNEARYTEAFAGIAARGLVYPCECTRREIAERVPHAPGEEPRYPGTCRAQPVDPHHTTARRVRVDDRDECFDDLRLGPMLQSPARQCGDVLVRDRVGNWTYQFAVTVDDAAHDIDVIIRGEDLLASTGRQRYLARLLGRDTMPLTLHHPLLVHPDGTKLSKANRDTSLRERRDAGASPEQLIGEAAYLAGYADAPGPVSADEVGRFFE